MNVVAAKTLEHHLPHVDRRGRLRVGVQLGRDLIDEGERFGRIRLERVTAACAGSKVSTPATGRGAGERTSGAIQAGRKGRQTEQRGAAPGLVGREARSFDERLHSDPDVLL